MGEDASRAFYSKARREHVRLRALESTGCARAPEAEREGQRGRRGRRARRQARAEASAGRRGRHEGGVEPLALSCSTDLKSAPRTDEGHHGRLLPRPQVAEREGGREGGRVTHTHAARAHGERGGWGEGRAALAADLGMRCLGFLYVPTSPRSPCPCGPAPRPPLPGSAPVQHRQHRMPPNRAHSAALVCLAPAAVPHPGSSGGCRMPVE